MPLFRLASSAFLASCAALAIAALAVLTAGPAAAQQMVNKPVYFPHTKSYFEMVRMSNSPLSSGIGVVDWPEAKLLAERRTYKGARGRLALVTDPETNAFLRDTFKPQEPAWIGLRYWCAFGKLQWVTGDEHPLTAYANWDVIWNRNAVGRNSSSSQNPCPRDARTAYLAVHYWPTTEGFFWNAHTSAKKFPLFYVEYPTGHE